MRRGDCRREMRTGSHAASYIFDFCPFGPRCNLPSVHLRAPVRLNSGKAWCSGSSTVDWLLARVFAPEL